ncbi:MAG TPA: CPBP family intramembrane metalloprotease [Thermoanaerobacterales bacterium]|nr:CPBP family intramembrane metalloprotease [Thermoanaerobacterales bacterium]
MSESKQTFKEIKLFLIYTFFISWLFWLIIIIANRVFDALWYGELLTWMPMLIGSLGPPIGAYMIYRQSDKSISLKSFIKLVFNRDIDKKAWLIFGLFTCWRFLMVWIAFGIQEPISILYMFLNLPLFIIGGGLEEIGWRGYLQPKLEQVTGYLVSVLIVGAIWSIWHLPLWLISGTVQSALPFTAYTILAIILSFSFTTFYKYTKNIFLCVLSHAWFNGCIGLTVYVGSEGYLQLNLNWKVYMVFILELIVAIILGMKYKSNEPKQSKSCYAIR